MMKWIVGGTIAYVLLFAALSVYFLSTQPSDSVAQKPTAVDGSRQSQSIPTQVTTPKKDAPATPSEKQSEYYDRAYKASEEKRWEDAISLWTKAIDEWPDYAKAYGNRGLDKMAIGRSFPEGDARRKRLLGEGLVDLTKAFELDPSIVTPKLLAWKGHGLYSLERDGEAIGNCTKAISLDPKNALAYLIRGLALFRLSLVDNLNTGRSDLNELSRAVSDLRKAIELNPACREVAQPQIDNYNRMRLLKGLPPEE